MLWGLIAAVVQLVVYFLVRRTFGPQVFEVHIPALVRYKEAASSRRSVFPATRAAALAEEPYYRAAHELVSRLS